MKQIEDSNMFHEIKRIKQVLSKEECIKILEEQLRSVLSLNGDDDYPYGMPLNHFYVQEENRLYFHGGKFGYKMDCIKRDNKCSYCVMKDVGVHENGWARLFESVIVFGKIHFVEDKSEIAAIARKLSHKFTLDDTYIEHEIKQDLPQTAMYYIEIEHMTGKRVTER